jgi:hypothetical protein
MISVREYEEQLVAGYRDRLARVERGEFSYSAEEQAIDLQRLKKAIAILEQDLEDQTSLHAIGTRQASPHPVASLTKPIDRFATRRNLCIYLICTPMRPCRDQRQGP